MDNKRKYKLPSVNDLNKDQDKVLRLPESGRFLVIGGPGTGKSVISLMRMQKYRDHGNYIFLVYNRVLMESTKQIIKGSLNGETWISWFNNQFFQLTNEPPPSKPRNSYKNPDDKVIDFAETIIKITEFYEDLESDEKGLHIIIDEGLSYQVFDAKQKALLGDSKIIIVKINPDFYILIETLVYF